MKALTPLTLLLLSPSFLNADVLADFTLEEWTETSGSSSLPFRPTFTATSTLAPGIASVSASSVNSSGSQHLTGGSGNNEGEINWANWTGQGTNYLAIEVTPANGGLVTLQDLTLSIARNGAGAPKDLYVWVIAGSYTGEELDPLNSDANVQLTNAGLDVQNGGITTPNRKVFDLTGAATQGELFSVILGGRVLDDETAGGQGNLRINEMVINGETSITGGSGTLRLTDLSYDPATGNAEVSIVGSANTNYQLFEAENLDFPNSNEPVTFTGASVGFLVGDTEVITDENGNATVQFNLGAAKAASFLRAQEQQS